jgi:hypothetical protein
MSDSKQESNALTEFRENQAYLEKQIAILNSSNRTEDGAKLEVLLAQGSMCAAACVSHSDDTTLENDLSAYNQIIKELNI